MLLTIDMTLTITEAILIEAESDFSIIVDSGRVAFRVDLNESDFSSSESSEILHEGLFSGCSADNDFSKPQLSVGEWRGKVIGLVDGTLQINSASLFWYSLRELLPLLPSNQFDLYARAVQLSSWKSDHRFCGGCSHPTTLSTDDRSLRCSNCERRYYPKLSPCVIGIVKKENTILLANGVKHTSGIYSALAGFIEPGESAEQAFHREVLEEVGIYVKNVRYHSSQNWPFPGQLMLGYIADYAGGEITPDPTEIADAKWCSPSDLPQTPPDYTISGWLIQQALQELR